MITPEDMFPVHTEPMVARDWLFFVCGIVCGPTVWAILRAIVT